MDAYDIHLTPIFSETFVLIYETFRINDAIKISDSLKYSIVYFLLGIELPYKKNQQFLPENSKSVFYVNNRNSSIHIQREKISTKATPISSQRLAKNENIKIVLASLTRENTKKESDRSQK